MTKLYTGSVPNTTIFLSSLPPENVDLSQYRQIFLNVNGTSTSFHISAAARVAIYQASQNKLPDGWISQLIYDSIELEGTDMIHKLTLEKQIFSQYPEEVELRLTAMREAGFDFTEQDI